MSEPTSTVTACQLEQGQDDVQKEENQGGDWSELVANMGMNATCIQAAKTAVDNEVSASSLSTRVGYSVGFMASASANLDAKHSASKTNIENSMQQQGCGTFMADLVDICKKVRNSQCTMRSQEDNMVSNVSSEAIIEIGLPKNVTDLGQRCVDLRRIDLEEARMRRDTIQDTIDDMKRNGLYDEWPLVRDELIYMKKRASDYPRACSINVSNSTIKATSDVRLVSNITSNSSVKSALKDTMESVTGVSRDNSLSRSAGLGSLSENLRQVSATKSNEDVSNVNELIDKTIKHTGAEVESSSRITLFSFYNTITNSTLHANSVVDVISTQLTTNAIDAGLDSSRKLLTDLVSKSKTQLEAEGLGDLYKAIADGNAQFLKEHNSGFTAQVLANRGPEMISAVAGIVAMVVLFKMIKGGMSPASAAGTKALMETLDTVVREMGREQAQGGAKGAERILTRTSDTGLHMLKASYKRVHKAEPTRSELAGIVERGARYPSHMMVLKQAAGYKVGNPRWVRLACGMAVTGLLLIQVSTAHTMGTRVRGIFKGKWKMSYFLDAFLGLIQTQMVTAGIIAVGLPFFFDMGFVDLFNYPLIKKKAVTMLLLSCGTLFFGGVVGGFSKEILGRYRGYSWWYANTIVGVTCGVTMVVIAKRSAR
jgi:hypothetical protein